MIAPIYSFISPKESIRQQVRQIIDGEEFEVRSSEFGVNQSNDLEESETPNTEHQTLVPSEVEVSNTKHKAPSAKRFHLIHMNADLEYCKAQKPEFYQKVEEGVYKNVPGVDEEFENPEKPDLLLINNTDKNIDSILTFLKEKNVLLID